MQPIHALKLRALPRPGAATLIALAAAFPAHADTINLNAADGLGTSSFNAAGNWSNGSTPSAGNDYVVAIERLRTPVTAADYSFAGDSLKLTTAAGKFSFKVNGSSVITVPHLILEGGIVDHINASDQLFTLAGSITVTGSGSRIAATQGPINVTAPIGGSGELTIINNLVTTFSGANTFTGSLIVNGAFVLAESGSLAFDIGASGVNNSVSGTSSAAFNGTFTLDLADAGNTIGDQWTLVDVAALAESFGPTFTIAGFIGNNGFWTSPDGKYQFNQATGILSRISGDSDGDGLPDTWENLHFSSLDWGALDDPDGDYATNLLEYQSTTDPDDDSSWPDTDGDTLNDGWERAFFTNSLAQGPGDDPDNDHNSNLAEYEAGTDPMTAFSYPDSDGDGMNDGWELFHFPEAANVVAVDPEADPDGDLSGNLDEFLAFTDPNDQLSSPDRDFDGLPDGWEVKYFRVGAETLAEVTDRYDETGDPDGDGYPNLAEHAAATDPTDAESVPGPLAYWRFEDATSGSVPGDEGGGLYIAAVADASGSGNALRTWSAQTAPEYRTDVPFATVPASGQSNTASLYFDAGTDGSWGDIVWTDTQAPLRWTPLTGWTVEAGFKLDPAVTGGNQAILSKDGNPLGGQPPFHLKYLAASGKLEIGLIDGSGTVRYLVGETTIESGKWYSAAATATATTLSLWIKAEGAASHVLDGTMPIDGAFYNSNPSFNDAWAVGRARWNGGETDWFKGWIDEVRISGAALTTDKFLAAGTASPFADWAAANIPDAGKRGESDDADGDGTLNIDEFLLGLDPADGSSFFAASLSGSSLTWPAANGLVFVIERSTTLATGGWDEVGTVTATGATASWTDPAPPSGKAFYRVTFGD